MIPGCFLVRPLKSGIFFKLFFWVYLDLASPNRVWGKWRICKYPKHTFCVLAKIEVHAKILKNQLYLEVSSPKFLTFSLQTDVFLHNVKLGNESDPWNGQKSLHSRRKMHTNVSVSGFHKSEVESVVAMNALLRKCLRRVHLDWVHQSKAALTRWF